MDYLKSFYNKLPRSFGASSDPAEQVVISAKTAVTALCAACSIQVGPDVAGIQNGASELPYYGRSPPVYPSRKVLHPSLPRVLPSGRRTNSAPKQLAMAPPTPGGLPPTATLAGWSRR